jgi:DNA-binding GntR family transcriptional regulator
VKPVDAAGASLSDRKRETRADDVRRRIRGDILACVFRPGERLQFPLLCERYGASVGVVREALASLSSQGLVRTQPHQGHIVSPLSYDDLAELTTARVLIEPVVLQSAIEQGSVEWEARVVAAHHVLSRTPRTPPGDPAHVSEEWAPAHEAFHEALFSGCTNDRLLSITRGLSHAAALYRAWSMPLEATRDVAAEHQGLVDAALARDVPLARERLREHIERTAQLLFTHVDSEDCE